VSLTYCVTDAEFDGPGPGENSMLAFATVALVDGVIGPSFEAVLAPLPEAKPDPGTLAWFRSEPEAYAFATKDPRPAGLVMSDFVAFVRGLPGTPVFASHPLSLDGLWFDYYLRRFTRERLMAGHRDKDSLFPEPALCIASFLCGRLGWEMPRCRYGNYPPEWLGNTPHTHRAIDDALGYAHLLKMLLAGKAPAETG
jgi:hypothetical protein